MLHKITNTKVYNEISKFSTWYIAWNSQSIEIKDQDLIISSNMINILLLIILFSWMRNTGKKDYTVYTHEVHNWKFRFPVKQGHTVSKSNTWGEADMFIMTTGPWIAIWDNWFKGNFPSGVSMFKSSYTATIKIQNILLWKKPHLAGQFTRLTYKNYIKKT